MGSGFFIDPGTANGFGLSSLLWMLRINLVADERPILINPIDHLPSLAGDLFVSV